MDFKLLIFSRVISIVVCIYIVNKVRKNLLIEKESMVWIIGSLLMVVIAFFPDILNDISLVIGIQYPPATLFLISSIIVLILLYRQFSRISVLTLKLNELVRTIALLSSQIDTMEIEVEKKK